MIRFVDLRQVDIPGSRFAFWDTVTDKFETFDDDQAWNTWDDFVESATYNCKEINLDRYKSLCPSWVFYQFNGELDYE